MILSYIIIILVLVQNGQRENCFEYVDFHIILFNNCSSFVTLLVNQFLSYNDSSKVAVKPVIDLAGSVPLRYQLLQLLYNTHGPFKTKFKPIKNENVLYNSFRDLLSKLLDYLERNGTSI